MHSYTLECHYQTGRRINTITPKFNHDTGEIEPEDPVTDRNNKIYKEQRLPNYTVEIFEDVGRSVCIALLEFAQCNPISRMPTSHYKNLESVRREIIVQNSLLPYDVMKDMRKEVAKEREAMKARQQKLMAQIAARELAQAKKAARLKEKEEKAEAAEKLKQEKLERMEAKRAQMKKLKVKTAKIMLEDSFEDGAAADNRMSAACSPSGAGGPDSPTTKKLKQAG